MDYCSTHTISGKGTGSSQFDKTLRGIAIDRSDRVYAVGDSSVKIFDADGALVRSFPTALDGFCVSVDKQGRIWVGEWKQIEIFDERGALLDTWRDAERGGLVTAIGFVDGDVFVADATARCIHRYDAEGKFLNDIGDKHRKGGFHIPNGVVDFAVDAEGILHVANPGMHRVESYKPDGELLGHFGKFGGGNAEGFQGCCNPTNVAIDQLGRVVVTEKANPRAKLYDRDGNLLAMISDTDFDLAAKNMDLAVDSAGRVYVADTAKLEILVFAAATRETEV